MTTKATNQSTALRHAVLVDAAVSGTMGVLLSLGAGLLAHPLGLTVALLRWTGVILIPFAAHLLWVATRANASPDAVRAIIGVNVVWAVGTPLLLVSGWMKPTPLGELFVLLQAVVVAGFAYLEYRGLRREGASLQPVPNNARRYGEEHGR
jgi:hypothetical protein